MVARKTLTVSLAVIAALSFAVTAQGDTASGGAFEPYAEISLMGGLQALNENDTAFPDRFVNIPAVASAAYHVTQTLAVEGEFTWMVPIKQNIDMGTQTEDLKSPDVLAYQANVRAKLPVSAWAPYVTAGAGAMTFLSSTNTDRMPQLTQSHTAFAVNFGVGATYGFNDRLAIRGDLREFVAFPSDNAQGLSNTTGADKVWMERGTVGLALRF